MALTIYENKEQTGGKIKVDRRLYENAAGELVEDDDPSAFRLYASAGKEVSREEFEARGGEILVAKAEAEPDPVDVADEPTPKKVTTRRRKKA